MYSWEYFFNNFVASYNTIGNLFLGAGLCSATYTFFVFVSIMIQIVHYMKENEDFNFSFRTMFWKRVVPTFILIFIGLSLKGL